MSDGKAFSELRDVAAPLNVGDNQLSLLGHDINSALNDVLSGLRLVDSTKLDHHSLHQMARIQASGEALSRLIEKALNTVQNNRERNEYDNFSFDLHYQLRQIERRWSGHAKALNRDFTISASDDIPVMIKCDQLALDRIMSNLIGNALKFSDGGPVDVTIEMNEENAICFTVSDHGPGFSQEALHKLFQFRGRPMGSDVPGSGMGLHIAKQSADMVGGHLIVNNKQKRGAEVSLVLPETVWKTDHQNTFKADLLDLTGQIILIADDNPTNRSLVTRMLNVMGAQCYTAEDGASALELIRNMPIDIAMIDIQMPNVNGTEVIKTIRKSKGPLANIPLIAITAYLQEGDKEAIYASGADGIIAKPFAEIDNFGQSLAAILAHHRKTSSQSSNLQIDRYQFDRLVALTGPEKRDELLRRLCADLRKIDDGIQHAAVTTSREELLEHSHVLISLSGSLGAFHLQHLAESLNDSSTDGNDADVLAKSNEVLGVLSSLRNYVETEAALRLGKES